MSTASLKKRRRLARAAQGFEHNPPRCINCEHYRPPVHAVPKKTVYREPFCNFGHFEVTPHSICDEWLGKDGETLLADEKEAA